MSLEVKNYHLAYDNVYFGRKIPVDWKNTLSPPSG